MAIKKKSAKRTSKRGGPKPIVIELENDYTREDLKALITPGVFKKLKTAYKTSDSAVVQFDKKIPPSPTLSKRKTAL
jgi:hypothetical protein